MRICVWRENCHTAVHTKESLLFRSLSVQERMVKRVVRGSVLRVWSLYWTQSDKKGWKHKAASSTNKENQTMYCNFSGLLRECSACFVKTDDNVKNPTKDRELGDHMQSNKQQFYFTDAVFTRDTFMWGKCQNVMQYNRNVNLPLVNVSRVNSEISLFSSYFCLFF